MDSGALAAVVGIGGVLVGAVASGLLARWLEVRKQQASLATAAVNDFVRALAASSFGNPAEARLLAADAKTRIAAYGTSATVEALHNFVVNGSSGATPACQDAIADMVLAARRDMRRSGSLSRDVIRAILF